MNQKKYTTMGTIEDTYKRAKEDDLGIAKNTLRTLLLSEQLPYVKVGAKKLINYDVLLEFLKKGSNNISLKKSELKNPEVR